MDIYEKHKNKIQNVKYRYIHSREKTSDKPRGGKGKGDSAFIAIHVED